MKLICSFLLALAITACVSSFLFEKNAQACAEHAAIEDVDNSEQPSDERAPASEASQSCDCAAHHHCCHMPVFAPSKASWQHRPAQIERILPRFSLLLLSAPIAGPFQPPRI